MSPHDAVASHSAAQTVTGQISLDQQKDDDFFRQIIDYLETGLLPKEKHKIHSLLSQIDDYFIEHNSLYHLAIPRGKNLHLIRQRMVQLCIPKQNRLSIMKYYHELAHDGFLKCYLTCRQRHFWRGCANDFRLFVEGCQICQTCKTDFARRKMRLTSLPAQEVLDCVHIDHHCMKNPSNGFKFILIMVDAGSGSFQLSPTRTQSAAETAQIFYRDYLSFFRISPGRCFGHRYRLFVPVIHLCR
jgi:hypothetical protein